MNVNRMALGAMLLAGGIAAAQTTETQHVIVRDGTATTWAQTTLQDKQAAEAGATAVRGQKLAAEAAMQFFTHIEGFDVLYDSNVAVKGAPYSAEAVTEMVQTLADGNRIVRKSSTNIARDGKGRTRREQTIGGLAPLVPAGGEHKLVTIDDPDSGEHYTLDPQTKTARKLTMKHSATNLKVVQGAPSENARIETFVLQTADGPTGAMGAAQVKTIYTNKSSNNDLKKEDLGKQTIEGLVCEGIRTTMTIPANTFGNERPIEVVNETWTSPELKTTVMKVTKDPRFGETTYKLTMVQRAEPLPSLFEVPADYKTSDQPGPQIMIAPRIKKDVKE